MARTGSINYLLGTAFYKLAFTEFGNPAAPAVICVHGLTRNGRDFDPLAMKLAEHFHVICPDLPGRGKSDWLPVGALYQPPTYVAALAHLLAYINKPVAWVGTSLGGICGMMTAAAGRAPITKIVLNDIGPFIPVAALVRIRDYMQAAPQAFPTMEALEAHLRLIHAPFGDLSDAQWHYLARISARPALADTGGSGFALHYDPKIIEPIRDGTPADVDLWPLWDLIKTPILSIRGATSDLLTIETFEQMQARGAKGIIVGDAGHAPALMDDLTIGEIAAFLQ